MAKEETEDLSKVRAVAEPKVELGDTGTLLTGGFITDADYNSDLIGLSGVKVYEKMRNDATVRASLWAMKLPILAASWTVVPGEEGDDTYQEHADFVEEELFGGTTHTWEEFLRNCLNYLDFGHYVFEIVYSLRDDGRIGWRKFAPRLPKTIQKWETGDGNSGITQWTLSGGEASIPIEKLIILTNEKEGDNWYGKSILRSSYRNWFTKDKLYQIEAMAVERQGIGIPYVKYPSGASQADISKAEEYLRNIRANEESFLSMKDGWEFGFMNMGSGTRIDPSKTIMHHNRQILINVLAQFMDLGGQGATGSFALSKDQSALFLLSLQYVANYVAAVISQYAIRRLIDINFGPQDVYPELRVTKIGQVDYTNLTASIERMVKSGIITVDETLEEFLRDTMGLPEMPEGLRAELDFNQFVGNMETEEAAAQAQDEQMVLADEETPDEEVAPGEEPVEANEMTMRNLFGVIFGAAGIPLSQEHRSKISEALKLYYSRRGKKSGGGGSKKGGKSKSKGKSKASKAATEVKKKIRGERRDKVKALRNALRDRRLEMKQRVLERKAKGESVTKEEYAQMKLDLLKQQKEMNKQIDKIDQEATKKLDAITASEKLPMKTVVTLKEKLDNAISKLQSAIGAD